MCTSSKFLHRCVTWETRSFRGRRLAGVKIKTSQVMLERCMIYHYWRIMGMAKFTLWSVIFCGDDICVMLWGMSFWEGDYSAGWLGGGHVLLLSLSLSHNDDRAHHANENILHRIKRLWVRWRHAVSSLVTKKAGAFCFSTTLHSISSYLLNMVLTTDNPFPSYFIGSQMIKTLPKNGGLLLRS